MAQSKTPTCIILSRQKLPTIDRDRYASAAKLASGAYVLADTGAGDPELLLIATGSEVSLALGAHERFVAEGVRSRVVSMPSWELFEKQPRQYREAVLPPSVRARVAVEQACSLGWDRYVGPAGATVTMSSFGASAPLARLQEKFGFTIDHVVEVARSVMLSETK
jgi:transketolase